MEMIDFNFNFLDVLSLSLMNFSGGAEGMLSIMKLNESNRTIPRS